MKAGPVGVSLTAALMLGPTLWAVPAAAQGRLVVQAGAARSLPEADAVGDAALYGMGGLALDWSGDRTAAWAAVHGGLADDESTGADFVSGSMAAEAWTGPGTAVGWTARASAFRVEAPFVYRTNAVRGGPAVRLRSGRFGATLQGELGAGTTLVEVRRFDDRVRRAERDLWHRGADLEVSMRGSRWIGAARGGRWSTGGGPFQRLEASLTRAWSGAAVRLEGGAWDTPLGSDWVGTVSAVVPLGGRASVTATAGRAAPDPLTLVEAGGQGGLLLGWDLATFGGPPPALVEVEGGRDAFTARFRLDDDRVRGVGTVEILGDFTGWAPAPMRRDGDAWVAVVPVTPGVHHYGFRVDGEWYVPEGHSGNVPDEWGRMNATLVVADEERGGGP